jgi:hypothetical protein
MHNKENIKCWYLDKPASDAALAEWDNSVMNLEEVECSTHPEHKRSGRRIGDLRILLPNPPIPDFLWTWYHELLIQDHVVALLQNAGFTGYELRPVVARFKRQRNVIPPRLWEIVVTGWGGIAPPESGVRLLDKCDVCGYSSFTQATSRWPIPGPEWDGSDFFRIWPYPLFILVTDRVAQFMMSNQLGGARCIHPANRMVNASGGTLSPGSVRKYLAPDHAVAFVRKYGIT